VCARYNGHNRQETGSSPGAIAHIAQRERETKEKDEGGTPKGNANSAVHTSFTENRIK
jgi:hypothetical protein